MARPIGKMTPFPGIIDLITRWAKEYPRRMQELTEWKHNHQRQDERKVSAA